MAVLFHRPDRNANPLRQIVAFQGAHDDAALQQLFEDRGAVAHVDENKIRRARDKRQPHGGEFILQISAAFVGDAFRGALMFFVGQSGERGGLGESADIERLPRFLQRLDQFRMRDSITDAQTGQALDLGKRAQDDDVFSLANELERVRRIVDILEVGFVERDARRSPAARR